jgi:hypothetical protein
MTMGTEIGRSYLRDIIKYFNLPPRPDVSAGDVESERDRRFHP